jgi:hypothetical protein
VRLGGTRCAALIVLIGLFAGQGILHSATQRAGRAAEVIRTSGPALGDPRLARLILDGVAGAGSLLRVSHDDTAFRYSAVAVSR